MLMRPELPRAHDATLLWERFRGHPEEFPPGIAVYPPQPDCRLVYGGDQRSLSTVAATSRWFLNYRSHTPLWSLDVPPVLPPPAWC